MAYSKKHSQERQSAPTPTSDIFRQITAPRSAFQKPLRARFGKQLHLAILKLGVSQSEFARLCNLPRDSISTYVLGKTLPSAKSAAAMSKVLGIDISEWLGADATAPTAIVDDSPSEVSVNSAPGEPGRAQLRINKIVKMTTALKVVELLENEDAPPKGR